MSSFWDKWGELLQKNEIPREELSALFTVLRSFDHEWARAGRSPPLEMLFLKQYPKWLVRSDPGMRLKR